jgi:acetyl esterase/lipase
VPAEWIEASDADLGVILYLHGGAYALGSINSHREIVARLARTTKMRGLAIDYRLAPEHPYPAALEDAIAAYLWLLTQGYDPSQIIIAGDSAGGGLALGTLVTLRDAGKPLPAGAVCISPWTDLATTGASIQNKAKVDLILDPDSLEKYAKYYAGEHELTSPLISPLYADPKGLPPLLIQVGTDEILLDDATRFTKNAQESGVDVTLEIWDQMFHVFQMISFLPETKKAVGNIAEFVAHNFK